MASTPATVITPNAIAGQAGSGDAGGALALVGGAGAAGFAGGNISLVGGAGATTGAAGTAVITGGAGGATNIAGGAVTITGGVGGGTGAGGATSLIGGASGGGATGNGGALILTGGAAASTAGTGGAVTITAGAGTTSGAGGALSLVSGAGGNAAAGGAIAITVGAATAAVGASITVTAGNGNGSTNGGGNINLVPGTAVSTGTPGEVQIAGTAGTFDAIWSQPLSTTACPASAAVVSFFMANRAYRIKAVSVILSTHGTSETFTFHKNTGTTAAGAGTAILTGAIAIAADNTRVAGTLSSTVATVTMAAGDRLSFTVGGTVGSAAGVLVSVLLVPV